MRTGDVVWVDRAVVVVEVVDGAFGQVEGPGRPGCGATNTGGYPNPRHYIQSGVWPEGHLADDGPLQARVAQAIAPKAPHRL